MPPPKITSVQTAAVARSSQPLPPSSAPASSSNNNNNNNHNGRGSQAARRVVSTEADDIIEWDSASSHTLDVQQQQPLATPNNETNGNKLFSSLLMQGGSARAHSHRVEGLPLSTTTPSAFSTLLPNLAERSLAARGGAATIDPQQHHAIHTPRGSSDSQLFVESRNVRHSHHHNHAPSSRGEESRRSSDFFENAADDVILFTRRDESDSDSSPSSVEEKTQRSRMEEAEEDEDSASSDSDDDGPSGRNKNKKRHREEIDRHFDGETQRRRQMEHRERMRRLDDDSSSSGGGGSSDGSESESNEEGVFSSSSSSSLSGSEEEDRTDSSSRDGSESSSRSEEDDEEDTDNETGLSQRRQRRGEEKTKQGGGSGGSFGAGRLQQKATTQHRDHDHSSSSRHHRGAVVDPAATSIPETMQKYQGALFECHYPRPVADRSAASSSSPPLSTSSSTSSSPAAFHTLVALTPQMTGLTLVGPCAVYGLVGDAILHGFHLGSAKHVVLPDASIAASLQRYPTMSSSSSEGGAVGALTSGSTKAATMSMSDFAALAKERQGSFAQKTQRCFARETKKKRTSSSSSVTDGGKDKKNEEEEEEEDGVCIGTNPEERFGAVDWAWVQERLQAWTTAPNINNNNNNNVAGADQRQCAAWLSQSPVVVLVVQPYTPGVAVTRRYFLSHAHAAHHSNMSSSLLSASGSNKKKKQSLSFVDRCGSELPPPSCDASSECTTTTLLSTSAPAMLRIPKCFAKTRAPEIPRVLLQSASRKTTLFAADFITAAPEDQQQQQDAEPSRAKTKPNNNHHHKSRSAQSGAVASTGAASSASSQVQWTKLQQAPPLRQILSTGFRQSTVLLAGPQHSGKSTLGRAVANALFSQHGVCFWLDLDLGRPEFSVSGTMSLSMITRPLLQPNEVDAAQLLRVLHVGGNRMHCPVRVAQACEALCDVVLQHELRPLVINTHGWIESSGRRVTAEVLRRIRPSFVLYTDHSASRLQRPTVDLRWLYEGRTAVGHGLNSQVVARRYFPELPSDSGYEHQKLEGKLVPPFPQPVSSVVVSTTTSSPTGGSTSSLNLFTLCVIHATHPLPFGAASNAKTKVGSLLSNESEDVDVEPFSNSSKAKQQQRMLDWKRTRAFQWGQYFKGLTLQKQQPQQQQQTRDDDVAGPTSNPNNNSFGTWLSVPLSGLMLIAPQEVLDLLTPTIHEEQQQPRSGSADTAPWLRYLASLLARSVVGVACLESVSGGGKAVSGKNNHYKNSLRLPLPSVKNASSPALPDGVVTIKSSLEGCGRSAAAWVLGFGLVASTAEEIVHNGVLRLGLPFGEEQVRRGLAAAVGNEDGGTSNNNDNNATKVVPNQIALVLCPLEQVEVPLLR